MAISERQVADELLAEWQRIIELLKLELGQTQFSYWLGNLHLIAANPGRVLLGVSSRFERDRVRDLYGATIAKLVTSLWPDFGPVEFEVSRKPNLAAPAPAPLTSPDFAPATVVPGSIPLNRAYSFANFVSGRANEIAVAQARQTAEGDTPGANPLFLFGSTGLGKSHLVHAIALRMLERDPAKRILYVTADWFVSNYVAAARGGDMDAFKNLVRDVDLLAVDDLHIIVGKEKTTDEFVLTLDAVLDAGKQIVLTADRSPALLEQLSERARSRLLKGTSVEIKASDFDLRLAILEAKVARIRQDRPNFVVGGEALRFMAQRINASTRQLEGALYRVLSHWNDGANAVTLVNLQVWLHDFLKMHDRRVTIEEVKVKVAAFYGRRVSDLEIESRARDIVRPRQLAMYLSRRLTAKSYPDIARRFKKKDHTTVMHAMKAIEAEMARDPEFANSVEQLRRSIRDWPDDTPPPL